MRLIKTQGAKLKPQAKPLHRTKYSLQAEHENKIRDSRRNRALGIKVHEKPGFSDCCKARELTAKSQQNCNLFAIRLQPLPVQKGVWYGRSFTLTFESIGVYKMNCIVITSPRYTIDGEPITVRELIAANSDEDNPPLPAEQYTAIRNLEVGESTEIGWGGASGFSVVMRTE